MQLEPDLTDPECAAGLLRYSFASDSSPKSGPGRKSRILFSLPGSTGCKHGKIWLSHDDGKSWPVQKKLRPGFFAYSCLTHLPSDASTAAEANGRPEINSVPRMSPLPRSLWNGSPTEQTSPGP